MTSLPKKDYFWREIMPFDSEKLFFSKMAWLRFIQLDTVRPERLREAKTHCSLKRYWIIQVKCHFSSEMFDGTPWKTNMDHKHDCFEEDAPFNWLLYVIVGVHVSFRGCNMLRMFTPNAIINCLLFGEVTWQSIEFPYVQVGDIYIFKFHLLCLFTRALMA